MMKPRLLSLLSFCFAAAAIVITVSAAAAEERAAPPAIVLELFTSQGCYSCPAADELLADRYSGAADLIPLEFHVDYWDDLVYGFAGSWKDPFSSPDYTRRQQVYNTLLRDTHSVYTPQLIVQGRHEAIGSNQAAIDKYITGERARPQEVALLFSGKAGGGWDVRVDGTMQGAEELVYAIYIRERITKVSAGENKDKAMKNTHIVRHLKKHPGKRYMHIPKYDSAEESCAAWLQAPGGAILAAGHCPEV